MEVQVFITSGKVLLRDSLRCAFPWVCTTLSTVFVDKGLGTDVRVCRCSANVTPASGYRGRGCKFYWNSLPCRICSRRLKCPRFLS